MLHRLAFIILAASILAACTSSKPERIETDQTLPVSPCACGPQVKPLLWDAA